MPWKQNWKEFLPELYRGDPVAETEAAVDVLIKQNELDKGEHLESNLDLAVDAFVDVPI